MNATLVLMNHTVMVIGVLMFVLILFGEILMETFVHLVYLLVRIAFRIMIKLASHVFQVNMS